MRAGPPGSPLPRGRRPICAPTPTRDSRGRRATTPRARCPTVAAERDARRTGARPHLDAPAGQSRPRIFGLAPLDPNRLDENTVCIFGGVRAVRRGGPVLGGGPSAP